MHSVETKVVERIYTLDIDNEDMNTRLVERIDTTGDENNFLSGKFIIPLLLYSLLISVQQIHGLSIFVNESLPHYGQYNLE